MADPAISIALGRLTEALESEIKLVMNVRSELGSLQMELRLVKAFLEEYNSNRARRKPLTRELIEQLRDAAFQAEDIVDDFYLMIDQRPRSGFWGSVASCLVCAGEARPRHQLGTRIEETRRHIREIHSQMITYQPHIETAVPSSSFVAPGTTELEKAALSQGLRVVGFAETEKLMTAQLLSGKDGPTVISVVGMGGIGKTTIAKKIYRRDEVRGHFKYKVWVTVSRQYSGADLLRNALEQVLRCDDPRATQREILEMMRGMREEHLVEELRRRLDRVRYLLVIDDIWEKQAWDLVKSCLPPHGESRVMLTTRIESVASYAQGVVYHLPFLSEDESWELFCNKVFPGGDCPPELVSVGRGMVKKCRGMPLAIIVLGGLLIEKEKTAHDWLCLSDRLMPQLNADRNEMIKNIMAVSYDDLSTDVKICFLYMGLFPEDMGIRATKLTQLWVAEGLVAHSQTRPTPEETAEEILKHLVSRSLLQVEDRWSIEDVHVCRIHDLLLDLAKSEGKKNRFLDICGSLANAPKVNPRRLAVHGNTGGAESGSDCLPSKLQTILCFDMHADDGVCSYLHSLKFLRVLDMEGAPIVTLPIEIGSLAHLTYLGLRATKLKSIPFSVGNLRKLQTLDVTYVTDIYIPECFWKLRSLRHIHASYMRPHASCGDLTKLQTLDDVVMGDWVEASLAKLSSLRKLYISSCSEDHLTTLSTAIERLKRLNILTVRGRAIPDLLRRALKDHVHLHELALIGKMQSVSRLAGQNMPQNLTKIHLSGCRLTQDPLALLEGLPYLSCLSLVFDAFIGEAMACSAGGFPRLRELYICALTKLRHMHLAEGAMKSLENLYIEHCHQLASLPEGIRLMRSLKELGLRASSDDASMERAKKAKLSSPLYSIYLHSGFPMIDPE